MAEFATIDLSREGPVATLTLNRPDVRNAMNPEMISEIRGVFDALSNEEDIRVIVIQGAGPGFCAGGDLNWMRDVLGQTEQEVVEDSRKLLRMYRAINDCPKLVIARLHGVAVAGALGIAACSDVVIAEAETKFCVSEVKLGLVAGIIGAFIIPRTGPGWFRYFAKTAVVFDADTARQAGLVHVVANGDDGLEAAVAQHVKLGLTASPDAIRSTGELVDAFGYEITEENFDIGLKFNAKARLSNAAQEGISAFLEKKSPAWSKPGSFSGRGK